MKNEELQGSKVAMELESRVILVLVVQLSIPQGWFWTRCLGTKASYEKP